MPTCIGLLRGVNLAGKRTLPMAALRDVLDSLGYEDPKTLLASGNVVFRSAAKPAVLEKEMESAIERKLGLTTELFVRTSSEWSAIVAGNPFPKEAKSDPGHLVLMLLADAPSPAAVKRLQAAIVGPEQLRANGRALYVTYPAGMGTSKLTSAVIDRTLATRCTGRNWNTVLKLEALAGTF